MNIAPRRNVRRPVSLTPLIDVVFILLLFFMLASSFLDWTAVELDARGETSTAASGEGALLIRTLGDGGYDIGGVRMSLANIESELRSQFAREPERKVVVQSGEGVALQQVITVVDVVRRAGGTAISLAGE